MYTRPGNLISRLPVAGLEVEADREEIQEKVSISIERKKRRRRRKIISKIEVISISQTKGELKKKDGEMKKERS